MYTHTNSMSCGRSAAAQSSSTRTWLHQWHVSVLLHTWLHQWHVSVLLHTWLHQWLVQDPIRSQCEVESPNLSKIILRTHLNTIQPPHHHHLLHHHHTITSSTTTTPSPPPPPQHHRLTITSDPPPPPPPRSRRKSWKLQNRVACSSRVSAPVVTKRMDVILSLSSLQPNYFKWRTSSQIPGYIIVWREIIIVWYVSFQVRGIVDQFSGNQGGNSLVTTYLEAIIISIDKFQSLFFFC